MQWHRITEWIEEAAPLLRPPGQLPRREVRGPWEKRVRTAVLKPWFPVKGKVKVLEAPVLAALEDYRPRALAGLIPVLRQLAADVLSSPAALPGLDYGVLAFTGIGRAALDERDRDLFWRAFQAPVFAQFRSWSGELLASECVAHRGLHIETSRVAFSLSGKDSNELMLTFAGASESNVPTLPTGLRARITSEPCPCGVSGPRLVGLRKIPERLIPALAATA